MKNRIIASALAVAMAAGLAITANAFEKDANATISGNIQLSTENTANTAPVATFAATSVGTGITSTTDVWTDYFSGIMSTGVNITEGADTNTISNVFNVNGFTESDFTTDGTNVNVRIPVKTGLTAGAFSGAIAFSDGTNTLTIPLKGTVTAADTDTDTNTDTDTGTDTNTNTNTDTNTALTAASGKIDDVRGGIGEQLGSQYPWITVSGMGSTAENGIEKRPAAVNNLTIRPDAQIKVYLTAYDFQFATTGGGVTQGPERQKVTTSQLRNGKITVKRSVSKGSNTIEDIKFDSDNISAYILIDFVEYFVSTSEQDVDFTIYLAKSGSRRRETDLQIAGTMENEEETVDAGYNYIDTSEGLVVEADEYVRGIEMYLGNNVYARLNMFKAKRYYGVALNTFDTTDAAIMDQYPEIDNVIQMRTVNVKGSGTAVYFDMGSSYYVYGADGAYLGLSNEEVPYSDKYYFATSRITINENGIGNEIENEIDTEIENGTGNNITGGENIGTHNPSTGANGFVGVAVLAGVVSLAAAGVTVSRKNRK